MYKIIYKKQALKFLEHVPTKDKERIVNEILSLAENPRKDGVIKLQGSDPAEYRTRQGDYRIVFSIHDTILEVWVIKIFARGQGY